MSIKEHQYSLITQITLTESMFIQTMNLGVSKNVVNSLQIYN